MSNLNYFLIKLSKTAVLIFLAGILTVVTDQVFFDWLRLKVPAEIYPMVYMFVYTISKIVKLKLSENNALKEVL